MVNGYGRTGRRVRRAYGVSRLERYEQRCHRGGDAVRLTREWSIAKAGEIGIIGGRTDECQTDLHITFNASCFRGRSSGYAPAAEPEYVSCSGGPATISTPVSRLRAPGPGLAAFVRRRFWQWKDLPRGGGGFDYELDVPLWEWDGRDEP